MRKPPYKMPSGLADVENLPLANLEEGKAPPETRIKDAESAHEIFSSLIKADERAAINRTRIQSMFDGSPPYSEAALEKAGQGFRCNLNFGEAESFLENAMAAYVDLLNSVETLVHIDTRLGDPKQRHEWSKVISEEVSRMIRAWPAFNFEFLNLCHHFVTHGVGINYHEDTLQWRWRSTGLGDVLIPKDTPASEERIEVAAIRRPISVTALYNFIKDEDAAIGEGWNITATKKAIMEACSTGSSLINWEKTQVELKNNDIYQGAKAAKVKLVHLFVQEFDGTVSHFIILESGDNKEFLLESKNKFGSIAEAFTFFPYGLGTNATYHGIRGLGYKIYPHIQVSNRLRSQVVDAAMVGSSVMVQPEDETALENFTVMPMGPFSLVSPGMKYVERAMPNLSNSVMPVLGELSQQAHSRAGQYSTQSVFQGSGDKSRYEIAAHLEQASKLSVTSLNLFYEPWDRHMGETVRRIIRAVADPDNVDDAITLMVDNVIGRGVPMEALMMVDTHRTRAIRSIGGGSQAKRAASLQSLNEFAGVLDSEGRHNLFRDQIAAAVGYDQVDRFMPASEDRRMPEAAKIATMENTLISGGGDIPVFSNEMHTIHLEHHVPFIEATFKRHEVGEMPLEEATPKVIGIFYHAVDHLEEIQGDGSIKEFVVEYNQRLQQLSELVLNGQKHLEKLQQEAAQEQGQEAQIDPRVQADLVEKRLKLQFMQEEHQLKMMRNIQEMEQKKQLNDARGALELQTLLKR